MPDKNQQPDLKLERYESRHGLYSTHVNNFDALWTAHDVRLIFGEVVQVLTDVATEQKTLSVEQRVAVTMAWSETKLLAAMLNDIIQRFERMNGEIKIPTVP
jgi:hypothetical protein